MEINIISGSNAPENTNVIMGIYNDTDQNININTLSTELKNDYTSFFNFTGNYVSLNIINAPYALDANHVTPDIVKDDLIVIDYLLLSETDKIKINNFINIFNK
jgi:hypothetical protein